MTVYGVHDGHEASASGLPDAELLRRARAGDADAFGQLWERYRTLAMSVASSLTAGEAEDVVADAFTVLWDKIRSGDGPAETFRGYLLATVRNLAMRTYRRTGRVLTGVEQELELEPAEDRTADIEHEELVRDVQIAFDALPPRWRKVLWKTEVELLPRSQVADDMHLSLNSTSQLLRRAKEALRVAWLNERFVHSPEDAHYAFIKDLPRYVRRGLSPTGRTKLQAHLSECGSCRAKEAQLRREDAFLASAVALLPLVGGAAWSASQTSVALSDPVAAFQGRLAEFGEWTRTVTDWASARTVALVATAVAGLLVVAAAVVTPHTTAAPSSPPADPSKPITSDGREHPVGAPSPEESTHAVVKPREEPPEPAQHSDTAPEAPSPSPPALESDAQTEPPSRRIAAPTIGLGAGFARTLPPVLVGTGEPGNDLLLRVSGAELTVPVGTDGRWLADLSGVGIGLGMHSARAVQRIDGGEYASAVLNFELTLPHVTAVAQPAGPTGARAQLLLTGVPGQRVCLLSNGATAGEAVLGADGTAVADVAARDYGSGVIGFRYCDGAQAGPEGQLRVF